MNIFRISTARRWRHAAPLKCGDHSANNIQMSPLMLPKARKLLGDITFNYSLERTENKWHY